MSFLHSLETAPKGGVRYARVNTIEIPNEGEARVVEEVELTPERMRDLDLAFQDLARGESGAVEDNFDINKGAIKHDGNKPRWDLLPLDAVDEIAQVFTYGAKKYDTYNWLNDMRYGRYIAATFRHLRDYWLGEDLDKESGLSHLAHAGANILMLLGSIKRGKGTDDRWKDGALTA